MIQNFWKSHLVLLIVAAGAFYFGGLTMLWTVLLLGALEISLSFDNAVVNAKVLDTMDKKWQDRFITWGIPVAVFGMRFIFPMLIVSVVSGISMLQAYIMATTEPGVYKATLEANQNVVFAFGGAFLLMVFLHWFFDKERDIWISIIEDNFIARLLKKLSHGGMVIALLVGVIVIYFTQDVRVATAYLTGILIHEAVKSVDDLFGVEDGTTGKMARAGLVGFLYLELLDASFSFDGVIGAFALSNNIFVIAAGLLIGAMYVRCLTIYFVKEKTLSEYKYLEHGAHYAIGALAAIMFIKMQTHVNELLVGTIGIGFIIIAVIHSIHEKKQEKKQKEKSDLEELNSLN